MLMLTDPFGRPLMEDVRDVPGVCVPGWVMTSSSRLRVVVGSSTSCRPTSVELTVALADCTTSDVAGDFDGLRDGADFQFYVNCRRHRRVQLDLAHHARAEPGRRNRQLVSGGRQRRDRILSLAACHGLEADVGFGVGGRDVGAGNRRAGGIRNRSGDAAGRGLGDRERRETEREQNLLHRCPL